MEKLRPQPLRLAVTCLVLALATGLNGCGWGGAIPEFSLQVAPSGLIVPPGSSSLEIVVQISPNRSYDVSRQGLTVTAAVPGSVITCVEANCTQYLPPGSYETKFHFNVSSAAVASTTNITFTASGFFSHHSASAVVTVAPHDWEGLMSPARASILRGTPVPGWDFTFGLLPSSITVTATPPAGFTCLQPGCTATFGNGFYPRAITMNTDPNMVPGFYPIPFNFTWMEYGVQQSVTIYSNITVVTQTPDFILTVSPVTSSVASAGFATTPFTVAVTPLNSFIEEVNVTVSTPPGFQCLENPCSTGLTDTNGWFQYDFFKFAIDPTLPPGPYVLTFTGTSASQTHTATVTVNIQ